jgi:hypothetical protein
MKFRTRPALLAAGVLVLLFPLIYSCSDDSARPAPNSAMEGRGDVDPATGGDFLLSTVDMGPNFGGIVEVWVYDLTVESDSVIGFDLAIVNATRIDIPPPMLFVITSIVPDAVSCANPDGHTSALEPFLDFSDDMGGDNVLAAGESTSRVHVRFACPEPMSFSIGFRLVLGEIASDGVIAGVVFKDANENGVLDGDEQGIPGVPVELAIVFGDSNQTTMTVLGQTDRRGKYEFAFLPAGVYRITVLVDPRVRLTTSNPLLVTLVELPDGRVSRFFDAHFGVAGIIPPPPSYAVFGPLEVGPASPFGMEVDSTFVIGPPMPPFPPEGDVYYIRVEPPMVMGPYAMYVDEVSVTIDGQGVYKFHCPADTLCPPPSDRLLIDPSLTAPGEHAIAIKVTGSDQTFVYVSVEHARWSEPGSQVKRP